MGVIDKRLLQGNPYQYSPDIYYICKQLFISFANCIIVCSAGEFRLIIQREFCNNLPRALPLRLWVKANCWCKSILSVHCQEKWGESGVHISGYGNGILVQTRLFIEVFSSRDFMLILAMQLNLCWNNSFFYFDVVFSGFWIWSSWKITHIN